jgi:SAM-dependent MidA family methyltransferase
MSGGAPEAERLDRFMARANAAYYAHRNPYADFITAPEISQVFGEIIGLWLMTVWMFAHRPDRFLLVEAGPGRGTLMNDILRTMRTTLPACFAAAAVHFIERSPSLRAKQAALVPDAAWHDSLDTVPGGLMFLIANEFLDALPIRQFVRRGSGWTERYVAGGAWVERPLPPRAAAALVPQRPNMRQGAVVEVNEAARAFVDGVARRIVRDGGAALLIDYGPAKSDSGDSLQAISGGAFADPLANPGHADLTAHVDFSDLSGVARQCGAMAHGPVTQGAFLDAWGVFDRVRRLAARQPTHAEALQQGVMRLTDSRPEHPGAMGAMFKVLAITPRGTPDPLWPA